MKKYILPAAMLVSVFTSTEAHAHAVAGDRVFLATMAVDDPGVADELNTQVQSFKNPADNGGNAWSTQSSFEYDKRLTQDLAISVHGAYIDTVAVKAAVTALIILAWELNIKLGLTQNMRQFFQLALIRILAALVANKSTQQTTALLRQKPISAKVSVIYLTQWFI